LSLPEDVIKLIENQKLTSGHAKILVGLENASIVAAKILDKKLSVRQTESLVKFYKNNKKIRKKFKDANIQDLENSISEKIGLIVSIKNNKRNKGSISFFYKDVDQLNKLINVIKAHY